ncbi:serine hydrolase domain-containing protein [Pseudomonas spirodelae]|uniref:Serine hydrolase domain-containing protein n=1 Tax=Pseudomonas spirodelae TaxID=3101751 RepID=A0ABU5PAT1_9PSED|nr:serine hydrolase domain-containing protein [Pseudomonas sp. T5W1]MEA1606757.1 serine hydrolase domain-containing protein [Pseudomonas sp. T5W1]
MVGAWQSGVLLRHLPRPVTCSATEPEWLEALVELSREIGWPGFQFSYVDTQGARVDCAVGWAGLLQPMRTDHVMRYASLSKLFTSLVMAQLFAEDRLHADDLLVKQLGLSGPLSDPRVEQITLGQLLRHTAGFDRAVSSDPMLMAQPWCPTRLGDLQLIRLDHAPGSHYAYSNLGYCLLGAVIAKAEGEALDKVYRRRLLAGHASTSIAPVVRGEIREGEPARYFEPPESSYELLSLDYESLLAVGAWTGTARDLLSLLADHFESDEDRLLESPRCTTLAWRVCHGPAFYAYQQDGGEIMYWRDGSLPGASSFVGIFEDGAKIVVLANGRHLAWVSDSDRLGQALYQWLH